MKILFVVKNPDFIAPIGVMQISAVVKQKGHETDLIFLSEENVFDKIEKYKPDIVAYTCETGEHDYYSEINKQIKSKYKDIFTIMGGPHASFFQKILDDAELDAICVAEGEYAFEELLEKLEEGEDISHLRNIIVRGGKLNGLRPPI